MAGKASILGDALAVRRVICDWPDVRAPWGIKKGTEKEGWGAVILRHFAAGSLLEGHAARILIEGYPRPDFGPDVGINVGMTDRL